jgi:hypothetical protein
MDLEKLDDEKLKEVITKAQAVVTQRRRDEKNKINKRELEVKRNPKFKKQFKELTELNKSINAEVKQLSKEYAISEMTIWDHIEGY